jgi:hypothetical protein
MTILTSNNINDILKELSDRAKELHLDFYQKDFSLLKKGKFYHVRSQTGAKLIVQREEILFSSHQYLQDKLEGDKKEIDLGFSNIGTTIVKRAKSESFFERFGGNFSKLNNKHSLYIFSASKNPTIKLCEEYSKNSDYRGAILEFEWPTQENGGVTDLSSVFYHGQVFYQPKIEPNREFRDRINAVLDLVLGYIPSLRSLEEERDLSIELAGWLLIHMPMVKSEEFEWEQEHRLVMPGFSHNGKRYPCDLPLERFREPPGKNKSHFAQTFPSAYLTNHVDFDLNTEEGKARLAEYLKTL